MVGAVFFGMAAMVAVVTWSVTSPAAAGCSVLLDVMWCSAAVVVV